MSFSSRPPESPKTRDLDQLAKPVSSLARDLGPEAIESGTPVQYPSVSAMNALLQAVSEVDADAPNAEKAALVNLKLRELVSAVFSDIEKFANQERYGRGYSLRLINALADFLPPLEQELLDRQINFTMLDVIGSDPLAEGLFTNTRDVLITYYSRLSKPVITTSETIKPSPRPAPTNGEVRRHPKTELGMGQPEQAAVLEAQKAAEEEAAKLAALRPSKLPDASALGMFATPDDEPTTPGDQPAEDPDNAEPELVAAPEDPDKDRETTNVFINPGFLAATAAHSKANGLVDVGKRPSPVPPATVFSPRDMTEAVEEAVKSGKDPFPITGDLPAFRIKVPELAEMPSPVPSPVPESMPEQAISPLPEPPSLKVDPLPAAIANPDQYPTGIGPTPLPGGRPAPLDPLPLPAGLTLPSSFLPKAPEASKSNGKILVRDITDAPERKEKPKKPLVTKLRATFAAAILAVTGLSALAVSRSHTESKPAIAGTVQLANTATPKLEKAEPVQPKVEQVEAPSETGLFKVDTSYSGYQKYLTRYKQSSGLIQIVQDLAEQTRVEYRQNPVEAKKLSDEGKLVLTGTESEAEQQIAMFDAFLRIAAKKNLDNYPTVKSYFNHHRAALARYQKTGRWDAEAIGYGSKEFAGIFGKPLKFKSNPNVVGYTFDNNPETNRALGKIKSAAPTYYRILLQAGEEMKKETDPGKISKFDDPMSIKTFACARVAAIGQADKNPDVRSGIGHTNGGWCKTNDANPDNYLNQAMQKTIPIMPAQPAAVVPTALPQKPDPQGTFLPNIAPQQAEPIEAPVESPKAKSGLWNKLKSIFSSEQQVTEPALKPVQPAAPQQKPVSQSIFNKGISTTQAELAAKAKRYQRFV